MSNGKMFWCLLFMGISNFVYGFNFKVPDPRCNVEDFECVGELTRSMLKLLTEGNKELGIEPIDPMHHALIEGQHSEFKYTLTDSVVVGFKETILNYLTIVKGKSMHFDYTIPYYEHKGKYKISGKLLNVPVDEEGTFYFNFTNLHMVVDVKKEFYEKNGHLHTNLTDCRASSEVLGSVHFSLKTPSGELKTLRNDFEKLVNENPEDVTMAQVIELWLVKISLANANKIYDEYNKLLEVVPITDIVDGEA